MKHFQKLTVYALALLVLSAALFAAFGPSLQAQAQGEPSVAISSDGIEVPVFDSLQLRAQTAGFSGEPSLRWKSSDPLKAAVSRSASHSGTEYMTDR